MSEPEYTYFKAIKKRDLKYESLSDYQAEGYVYWEIPNPQQALTAEQAKVKEQGELIGELEGKLDTQMLANQDDIQNWIIALQSFNNICVGRSYEKHIKDGMMKLIGSYPKNEWYEEKEQELIAEYSQAKQLQGESK